MNVRTTVVAVIICCAFLSVSTFAQTRSACSPIGTWYGGSNDVKALMTIAPITGAKFTIRAEIVGDVAAAGAPAWTSWTGQLVRSDANRYVSHEISMYTSSPTFPPAPDSYELDGVRGYLSFTDCNNIRFTYDFYGVYFDLNKVPFVDSPDINVDMSGSLETYRRVPTACPVCGGVVSSASGLRKR